MRVGMNPQKQAGRQPAVYNHRIVVIVFVPELSGYYEQMFEVFKLTLSSLIHTVSAKTAITVVDNACCSVVAQFIREQHDAGHVETVIRHNTNIGKMDAMIGAARAAREPLITVTDADVLFEHGWQAAVERVFQAFRKAGAVSPIAVRSNVHYETSSTLKDIVLGKLQFKWMPIPGNFKKYSQMLASFGQQTDRDETRPWPVVTSDGVDAILGCAHQVMTVRRSVFLWQVPVEPSRILVGNDSERAYLDEPVDRGGYYRLCLKTTKAYHMGNVTEPWMHDLNEANSRMGPSESVDVELREVQSGWLPHKLTARLYTAAFKRLYKSMERKTL